MKQTLTTPPGDQHFQPLRGKVTARQNMTLLVPTSVTDFSSASSALLQGYFFSSHDPYGFLPPSLLPNSFPVPSSSCETEGSVWDK